MKLIEWLRIQMAFSTLAEFSTHASNYFNTYSYFVSYLHFTPWNLAEFLFWSIKFMFSNHIHKVWSNYYFSPKSNSMFVSLTENNMCHFDFQVTSVARGIFHPKDKWNVKFWTKVTTILHPKNKTLWVKVKIRSN